MLWNYPLQMSAVCAYPGGICDDSLHRQGGKATTLWTQCAVVSCFIHGGVNVTSNPLGKHQASLESRAEFPLAKVEILTDWMEAFQGSAPQNKNKEKLPLPKEGGMGQKCSRRKTNSPEIQIVHGSYLLSFLFHLLSLL